MRSFISDSRNPGLRGLEVSYTKAGCDGSGGGHRLVHNRPFISPGLREWPHIGQWAKKWTAFCRPWGKGSSDLVNTLMTLAPRWTRNPGPLSGQHCQLPSPARVPALNLETDWRLMGQRRWKGSSGPSGVNDPMGGGKKRRSKWMGLMEKSQMPPHAAPPRPWGSQELLPPKGLTWMVSWVLWSTESFSSL